jgi:hypothetical protein
VPVPAFNQPASHHIAALHEASMLAVSLPLAERHAARSSQLAGGSNGNQLSRGNGDVVQPGSKRSFLQKSIKVVVHPRQPCSGSGTWCRFRPPTTLAASESDGGLGTKITFERVIVMPDGHRYIEGKTPLPLPAPASPVLPNSDPPASDTSDINDLDG